MHVKVESGHGGLEAFDVDVALLELLLEHGCSLSEIFNQRHHGTRGVQVGVIVFILDGDASDGRCAMQCGMGVIGYQQAAVELPVNVMECEVSVPHLSA